jgi:hypothetical protein
MLSIDMLSILGGIVVLVLTVVVFVTLLPRGGKTYRFADTEWEPYVGVAFCSATALGVTLALSGVLNLMGSP